MTKEGWRGKRGQDEELLIVIRDGDEGVVDTVTDGAWVCGEQKRGGGVLRDGSGGGYDPDGVLLQSWGI